ncbi:hypothetical protein [Streptomyces sp. H27-C3]|nr:hypothetical protein [Streptomyces sp. H27-C3]MDJ0463038.1 hypothetical protein [Streptomyces sp. H27-C3]
MLHGTPVVAEDLTLAEAPHVAEHLVLAHDAETVGAQNDALQGVGE